VRVSDIVLGRASAVEIEREDGDSFPATLTPGIEVEILAVGGSGDTLLRIDGEVVTVAATDRPSRVNLAGVTERNLPRLCWLAGLQPKGRAPRRITVQVHEFPAQYRWTEEISVGVDDRILDQVRQQHLTALAKGPEVLDWLTHQLLMPALEPDGPSRMLISASPGGLSDRQAPFRVYGQQVAVDIRSTDGGPLRVERMVHVRVSL